jgi:hypothetical protein
VPRDSAVIGLPGDRETQLKINAIHSDMCRFDATQETDQDNYELVDYNMNRLCREALAQGESLLLGGRDRESESMTFSGNGDDSLQRRLNALPVIM